MKKTPDFFLSGAGEHRGDIATPRACWTIARLRNETRDDHMLIEIDPPLIGQAYGLGGQDITNFVITSRYQGFTLFPIKEWPCHVYIARILDQNITKTLEFTRHQIELLAWGRLFLSIEEAAGDIPKKS
jgi:hypothetical protein